MKRAFTLLELVFIIVIIGILAAVILPRTKRSPTREAAIQLVSHIRYTQHLALVDDKYLYDVTIPVDPSSDEHDRWWKARWQLKFEKSANSNNKWSYTIFSDHFGSSVYSGNPNSQTEIATNPQNQQKKLTGGTSAIPYNHVKATTSMNIGTKYGISNVVFSNSCHQSIIFDYIGRPMTGTLASFSSPYPINRLLVNDCNITLVGQDENVSVIITPQTGYTYIAK